jgi:Dihaem cytochrome c
MNLHNSRQTRMPAQIPMPRVFCRRPWHRAPLIAILLGLSAMTPARADAGWLMPQDLPAGYKQECGSCHLAYPPGLMPARSWQRLMGGLEKHYGSDASLDPVTLQQIRAWLVSHAGTGKRVNEEPPQDRITRSAWFERKHRKIDPGVWNLASVKSASHCASCHSAAERGDFDDDRLQFPAGLDARQRRSFND